MTQYQFIVGYLVMAHTSFSDIAKVPLLGMWSVQGSEVKHLGALYAENEQLRLRLFIDEAQHDQSGFRHPTIDAASTLNQLTCTGTTRSGVVTLFRCVYLSHRGNVGLSTATAWAELVLVPTCAWIGSAPADDDRYCELSFEAPGLHDVLTTCFVEFEWLHGAETGDNERQKRLRELTPASYVYFVHQSEEPSATIKYKQKTYAVAFSTRVGQSSSSTAGVNISSQDRVTITSPDGATIDELMGMKRQIDHFLSILCLAKFGGGDVAIRHQVGREFRLLWELGQQEDASSPNLMRHQVLASIGQYPSVTRDALIRWFNGSEARQLARWLIYDSLSSETFSSSTYVAVATAWELVGGESYQKPGKNKKLLAQACKECEPILNKHFRPEDAKRIENMVKTNFPRPSFKESVKSALEKLPDCALRLISGDISKFLTRVTRVRNTFAHMRTSSEVTVEEAARISMFLVYKLIVLYCIFETQDLGFPLDNLETVLRNNKFARKALRPLP